MTSISSGWLHVIGIGENGLDGLAPPAIEALRQAELVLGGDRHPALAHEFAGQRIDWPEKFDELVDLIRAHRARRLAILVVGDPLWYSVGARIARALPDLAMTFHPQISAFQYACCRLGWSMADTDLVTTFGRSKEQIVPYLQPEARIIALAQNGRTPLELAAMLKARRMGASEITAMWHLGGDEEGLLAATAEAWNREVPDFLVVAIQCRLDPGADWLPRSPGLPNAAFRHDEDILPPEIRAATLAKLAPRRGRTAFAHRGRLRRYRDRMDAIRLRKPSPSVSSHRRQDGQWPRPTPLPSARPSSR